MRQREVSVVDSSLARIGSLFASVGVAVAPVGFTVAQVGVALAIVCDSFPLVGFTVTLVSDSFPFVRDSLPFVGFTVAFIGLVVASVTEVITFVGAARTFVGFDVSEFLKAAACLCRHVADVSLAAASLGGFFASFGRGGAFLEGSTAPCGSFVLLGREKSSSLRRSLAQPRRERTCLGGSLPKGQCDPLLSGDFDRFVLPTVASGGHAFNVARPVRGDASSGSVSASRNLYRGGQSPQWLSLGLRIRFGLVGAHFPFVGGSFSLVGVAVALVGVAVSFVRDSFPVVGESFAQVGLAVALVGDPIPFVGDPIPFVGNSFPFVGVAVALVGDPFAPVGDPFAPVGGRLLAPVGGRLLIGLVEQFRNQLTHAGREVAQIRLSSALFGGVGALIARAYPFLGSLTATSGRFSCVYGEEVSSLRGASSKLGGERTCLVGALAEDQGDSLCAGVLGRFVLLALIISGHATDFRYSPADDPAAVGPPQSRGPLLGGADGLAGVLAWSGRPGARSLVRRGGQLGDPPVPAHRGPPALGSRAKRGG